MPSEAPPKLSEASAGYLAPEPQQTLSAEVERYVRLCEQGRFYDWMMQEFEIPAEERGRFKKRVFKYVMFGRHDRCRHSGEWKLFEKAFPQIAKSIREVKREYGHAALAHMLQRVESSLMINRVCRRLMRSHPEVPVITIHDSIMTTKPHFKLVRRLIEEEFIRVGLHPTLNVEEYRRDAPAMPTPRAKKRARGRATAGRVETLVRRATASPAIARPLPEARSIVKETPQGPNQVGTYSDPPLGEDGWVLD